MKKLNLAVKNPLVKMALVVVALTGISIISRTKAVAQSAEGTISTTPLDFDQEISEKDAMRMSELMEQLPLDVRDEVVFFFPDGSMTANRTRLLYGWQAEKLTKLPGLTDVQQEDLIGIGIDEELPHSPVGGGPTTPPPGPGVVPPAPPSGGGGGGGGGGTTPANPGTGPVPQPGFPSNPAIPTPPPFLLVPGNPTYTTPQPTTPSTQEEPSCPSCSSWETMETPRELLAGQRGQSGPYLKYLTSTSAQIAGMRALVYLPGRLFPLEGTTRALRTHNAVHDQSHLSGESALNYIYWGVSDTGLAAPNANGQLDHDCGLQMSNAISKYSLFITYGHGDKLLQDGSQTPPAGTAEMPTTTWVKWSSQAIGFSMNSYFQSTVRVLNGGVAYTFHGNRCNFNGTPLNGVDAFKPVTVVLVNKGFKSSNTRDRIKWVTSIGQGRPTGPDQYVPADITQKENWFCGVEWMRVEILPQPWQGTTIGESYRELAYGTDVWQCGVHPVEGVEQGNGFFPDTPFFPLHKRPVQRLRTPGFRFQERVSIDVRRTKLQ